MSTLERKWWFAAPAAFLSFVCVAALFKAAGLPLYQNDVYHCLISMLCYTALYRAISFSGWLLFLAVAPALADTRLAASAAQKRSR